MSLGSAPAGIYAFTQQGSFSHVNDRLRIALDAELHGLSGYPIDVTEPRRLTRGSVLNVPFRSLPTAARELGPLAVRNPRLAVRSRFVTTYMFRYRSAVARAQATALGARFVMQTQTLFDSSLSGVPFFIFTDHTALANKRYPVPPDPDVWSPGWIELERKAYARADLIFTTSEFARASLLRDYDCPAEKVRVCGSGTNLAIPARPVLRERPVRTIFFAGFEWERKGGPILIDAFRELRRSQPAAQLVIAGCRPELGEPGVREVGRVDLAGMDRLLREADVFCMPSWHEPSAVSYLDAAAYGLPVVATAVGGTPERVLDRETGFLCPPGDASAVADRLLRLMTAPAQARELGERGRAMVEARFTWQHVARLVADGVREVCLAEGVAAS